ncbi:MAG: hypothetical protein H7843_00575 [Nitrospirota bacterium]
MISGVGSTVQAVNDYNKKIMAEIAQQSAQSPTVIKEIQQNNNPEGTGSKINIYV